MNHADDILFPLELVQILLREAGIHDAPRRFSLLGVSTCIVWAFSAGDARYVVRQRLDGDADLAQKEANLSALLQQHGVLAPRVLALATGDYGRATLSTFVSGIRLDHAMRDLAPDDLRDVWRSVGATLRAAHEITFPVAGELVRHGVAPFGAAWGTWVLEDAADDIRWLHASLGDAPLDRPLTERVVAAAQTALADAPIRLVHNDARPQNIMVGHTPDGWRCTGWLDWEFARAADPRWDLATLDWRPAGMVPAVFYEGYGASPSEPEASIYDLLMGLWMTRAEREHGSSWDWPPQHARLLYLHDLPQQIARLAMVLGA